MPTTIAYQPQEIDFAGEGGKVSFAYQEFERDEKTVHKPEAISGAFGDLTLSYTAQGKFKGSSNDALRLCLQQRWERSLVVS